jgi:DNA repair protein RecN (Recombination protein N)
VLRTLAVRDFVIVKRVDLDLAPGFNVLTGETGAGKSILVDAIELLVGGRADAAFVREGAERAELAAEFDLAADAPLAAWLRDNALEGDEGSVLLRRTVDRGGRSRAFINGHAATLAQLKEAGESLVDIHGQHAHQSLLRAAAQRALLDAFGEAAALAEDCAAAYRSWRRLETLLSEAETQHARLEQERAQLDAQRAELERLAPRVGEWESLAGEHGRLANAASLLEGTQAAFEALSEAEGAMAPQLAALTERLRALAAHDRALDPVIEMLDAAQAQASEAARTLRQYASRLELDPAALREVEARIEALHAAGRKYRVAPADLPALADSLGARAAELERTADPQALRRELEAARTALVERTGQLSAKRKRAAQKLGRAVSEGMQGLAMTGGRFAVRLEPLEAPAASGAEAVAFEVAAHASLPLRPLARVASGGELSRISLALQLVLRRHAPVDTLVFDEIDSGIGGGVADTVGRSLRQLGAERQVLCVTHLPQVAAQGDAQWTVRKTERGGAIEVAVERLDRAARIEELARMLGGAKITATTRKHAAELLAG